MLAARFLRIFTEVPKVLDLVGQGALVLANTAHLELRKSASHRTG